MLKFKILFFFLFLSSITNAASTPIWNLKLQGSADANSQMITNLVSGTNLNNAITRKDVMIIASNASDSLARTMATNSQLSANSAQITADNSQITANSAISLANIALTNYLGDFIIETNRAITAENLLYPSSNPSGYVNKTITNGLASSSLLGDYFPLIGGYLNSNAEIRILGDNNRKMILTATNLYFNVAPRTSYEKGMIRYGNSDISIPNTGVAETFALLSNLSSYYLNSNPSGYVNQTITNGLAPTTSLTSYYPNTNPSNYITQVITNGLYPSSNPSGYVDKTITNGLAPTTSLSSYYPNSNPSNYITQVITNGLYPSSNPSGYVNQTITNGLAPTTSLTYMLTNRYADSVIFLTNLNVSGTLYANGKAVFSNYTIINCDGPNSGIEITTGPGQQGTGVVINENGIYGNNKSIGQFGDIYGYQSGDFRLRSGYTLGNLLLWGGDTAGINFRSGGAEHMWLQSTGTLLTDTNVVIAGSLTVSNGASIFGNVVINGNNTNTSDVWAPQPNGVQVIGDTNMDLYFGLGGSVGLPNWIWQVYRNEHPSATNAYEFMYLSNAKSRKDYMVISENGRFGINKASNIMDYHGEWLGYTNSGTFGLNDDLDWTGTYTLTKNRTYKVIITTNSIPTNTWTWLRSLDNGTTFTASGITNLCATTNMNLEYGVQVFFETTSGHNTNDIWIKTAFAQNPSASLHLGAAAYQEVGHTTNYSNNSGWRDDTYVVAENNPLSYRAILTNAACAYYIMRPTKINGCFFNLQTVGVNITLVAEYWNSSGTWTQLNATVHNYSDGTANLTQSGFISWDKSLMNDWVSTNLFPSSVSGSYDGYWIRFRTTTIPSTIPLVADVSPNGLYRLAIYPRCYDNLPSWWIDNQGNQVGLGTLSNVGAVSFNTNLSIAGNLTIGGINPLTRITQINAAMSAMTNTCTGLGTAFSNSIPYYEVTNYYLTTTNTSISTLTNLPYAEVRYVITSYTNSYITNNFTLCAPSATKRLVWETWINFTNANSYGLTWQAPITWDTPLSDITCTGMYKYAFSYDGTTIYGRQTYPTYYKMEKRPFSLLVGSTSYTFWFSSAQIMGAGTLTGSVGTVWSENSSDYMVVRAAPYGAGWLGSNTCWSGVNLNGYTAPAPGASQGTNGFIYAASGFSYAEQSAFGDIVVSPNPKAGYISYTNNCIPREIALFFTRTNAVGTCSIGSIWSRKANELEVNQYKQARGW